VGTNVLPIVPFFLRSLLFWITGWHWYSYNLAYCCHKTTCTLQSTTLLKSQTCVPLTCTVSRNFETKVRDLCRIDHISMHVNFFFAINYSIRTFSSLCIVSYLYKRKSKFPLQTLCTFPARNLAEIWHAVSYMKRVDGGIDGATRWLCWAPTI
jgi:hypothetical protein